MRSSSRWLVGAGGGAILLGLVLMRPGQPDSDRGTAPGPAVPPGEGAAPPAQHPKLPPFDAVRPAPAPAGPAAFVPTTVAGPEAPAPAQLPAPRAGRGRGDASMVPAPASSVGSERSPIRVDLGTAGLIFSTAELTRSISFVGPDGPRDLQVPVEGFDLTVAGPDGYQSTASYGKDQTAVLGAAGSLPDGLYHYTATPRLRTLVRPPAAPPGSGEPVLPGVTDAQGRDALDPMVLAAGRLEPVPGAGGTFRIVDGSIFPPDLPE